MGISLRYSLVGFRVEGKMGKVVFCGGLSFCRFKGLILCSMPCSSTFIRSLIRLFRITAIYSHLFFLFGSELILAPVFLSHVSRVQS